MTEPGKILRADYRVFQWSGYINYERTRKQLAGMQDLSARIERYLENRTGYDIRMQDRTYILEFERLDDARMFVLSFSDVIHNAGVNFE